MVLEWLTYLLNDIFSSFDSETNEEGNFKSALFTRSEDTGEYVPTGKYTKEVYKFVGKVIAIARYFGLGHSNKLSDCGINPEMQEIYEFIQKGADKMKFFRLETHEIGETDVLILKGRKTFVQIVIDDDYGRIIRFLRSTKYIHYFRKAFDGLTDAQKLKFLSLVLDERGLKDGTVKVSLNYTIESSDDGDFRIHKGRKRFEIKKFENLEDYKNLLKKIIE